MSLEQRENGTGLEDKCIICGALGTIGESLWRYDNDRTHTYIRLCDKCHETKTKKVI